MLVRRKSDAIAGPDPRPVRRAPLPDRFPPVPPPRFFSSPRLAAEAAAEALPRRTRAGPSRISGPEYQHLTQYSLKRASIVVAIPLHPRAAPAGTTHKASRTSPATHPLRPICLHAPLAPAPDTPRMPHRSAHGIPSALPPRFPQAAEYFLSCL